MDVLCVVVGSSCMVKALVAVRLGIGVRQVDLKALDRAYSTVFPLSTPLNVGKKRLRRTAGGRGTPAGENGGTAGGRGPLAGGGEGWLP